MLVGCAGADANQSISFDAWGARDDFEGLELVLVEEPFGEDLGQGGEVGDLGGFGKTEEGDGDLPLATEDG